MRIRILTLPPQPSGERPFALIVDRTDIGGDDEEQIEAWREFSSKCGAASILVTPDDVELEPR